MKKLWSYIWITILGGIFFVVPLVLLIIILDKAFVLSQKIIHPLLKPLAGMGVTGTAVQEIAGIILLLICCLLAGLFAKTSLAKKIMYKLESKLLANVPGYSLLKNVTQSMAGVTSTEKMETVIVKMDDGWQIAFLMEEIDEEHAVVFVPGAPGPLSGSVWYMEKKNIKPADIPTQQAFHHLRQMGAGGKLFLKGKL